jgi:hypothetical protein
MKQMAERMWIMVIDLIVGLFLIDRFAVILQERLALVQGIFRRLMR